jgi:hypothetical protein
MIKIRRSYDSASDNHERTLLRGEYKFFTGKICDLRGAHPDDMISYLESAYFFGFWDAEQVAKILEELSLHLEDMNTSQLVSLYCVLPGVKRSHTKFVLALLLRLHSQLDILSLDERLRLLSNVTLESAVFVLNEGLHVRTCQDRPKVIAELYADVVRSLEVDSSRLGPRDCASILIALGCVCRADGMRTLRACEGFVQQLKLRVLESLRVAEDSGQTEGEDSALNSPLDAAFVCNALLALETLDVTSLSALRSFFLARLNTCCATAMAMMFHAAPSLSFAKAVESRVVYLLPDFALEELLEVAEVYFQGLVESSHCPHKALLRTASCPAGCERFSSIYGKYRFPPGAHPGGSDICPEKYRCLQRRR